MPTNSIDATIDLAVMALSALPLDNVFAENIGDIVKSLDAAIAKTSRAVVVGFNGFTPTVQKANAIIGKGTLVISVFEKPVVNRAKRSSVRTCFSMACDIARALAHLPNGTSALFFKQITPVKLLDGGVISCDVIFETTVSL